MGSTSYAGSYGYSNYCYYPSYYYSGYSYPSYYSSNCYYPYSYSCYQPCYYYYACSGRIGSLSVCDLPSSQARGQIKRTETKLTLPASLLNEVE